MTVAIANTIIANGHTLEYLISRLNECAHTISNYAVTAGSNTTGNVNIIGTLSVTDLSVNSISVLGDGGTIEFDSITTTDFLGTNVHATSLVANVISATNASVTNLTGNNLISSNAAIALANIVTLSGNAATFAYGTFTTLSGNALSLTSQLSLGNSTVNVVVSTPNSSIQANGSYFLNANGNWSYVGASQTIGGSNTQIAFNDSGIFGASAGLTFNKTSNTLAISNAVTAARYHWSYAHSLSGTVLLSGTSQQSIDTSDPTAYRSIEYTVSLKDENANGYQISKMLICHDGGTASMTEYGTISTNASMGAFAVSMNSTVLSLLFTPVSTSVTAKFLKAAVVV